jgi:hypothetical protein
MPKSVNPPATADPMAQMGLNQQVRGGLSPSQQLQYDRDVLFRELDQALTHLRGVYGPGLTMLSSEKLAEALGGLISNDRTRVTSGLHRGIEHLRQTYGADLSIIPSGSIAERLVEMVDNERQQRGR